MLIYPWKCVIVFLCVSYTVSIVIEMSTLLEIVSFSMYVMYVKCHCWLTWKCPFLAASWRGVSLAIPGQLTRAPCLRSKFATERLPRLHASWRGDQPEHYNIITIQSTILSPSYQHYLEYSGPRPSLRVSAPWQHFPEYHNMRKLRDLCSFNSPWLRSSVAGSRPGDSAWSPDKDSDN